MSQRGSNISGGIPFDTSIKPLEKKRIAKLMKAWISYFSGAASSGGALSFITFSCSCNTICISANCSFTCSNETTTTKMVI